jgi:hypothetical protein
MTPSPQPSAEEPSTFDNTLFANGKENLERAIARQQHDVDFPHEKECWEEELVNPYGPNIRYRMWKTKSCGQPDCHHPIYSPMPI